ncbi:MAG TPA: sugar ABC transporter substrate-binding protein [Herpetosiphon sp.]|uniref:Monosaccharide-transporting ATPase n=1 Tax=Herpetosiphon aurantiacus (strain ATCC 23779 / DSM 785 / 114-95) TaxID=316274 RepID=A9AX36_HERA2|nr:sugar ABC transporter substrate-binding protein [Herpetosiphon sp.]ABX04844.1 Monosaccharide-transporting ATPase [Herpetosiphon aurantiacus DSM 785]HBW49912.1 sugar ABC transporter substrate-binding protein [Herpetosiphon sp.]
MEKPTNKPQVLVNSVGYSRRDFLRFGAFTTVGLLAGCGTTSATPVSTATPTKPKIGLVMKSLSNEFFQQMQAGAEEYARQNATRFDFTATGINDERDFATQIASFERLVNEQYDVIVLAPADSIALVAPVAKAVKAGIVVINIDVALDEATKKAAGIDLAFFGPDNRAGAKMSGEVLAKALGAGGKVAVLEGNPEADNAVQRRLGFDDAIADGSLNLVVAESGHWETSEGQSITAAWLKKYPDLQGIMCANDSMAFGAVQALEAANLLDKIKVVGFDNIPAVQPLIKDGKMLATVEQYGAQMAAIGMDYGYRTLKGEKFSGWIRTELKLITKDNL